MAKQAISLERFRAFIFDLDGIITRTATVHAAAWERLFNGFLQEYGAREGRQFSPFTQDDYFRYVDGKPRYDGVESFLATRGIKLPHGNSDDPPDRETVCGLGNRKNACFREALEQQGVEVFESTLAFIRRCKERGLKTAVISSSKNCVPVLKKAGALELFDAKVDGVDAEEQGLPGKPAPDIFLEAARRLGVAPGEAVVVEDAIAGVQAGAAGDFGCVIGVDRAGQPQRLQEAGADMVVGDMAEIATDEQSWPEDIPSALERIEEIGERGRNRELAVFLDYDGVLTPIVQRPEDARISPEMRRTVEELAERCTVAIVSGRDLQDVRRMAGVEKIIYAGSHGFEIDGPDRHIELQKGIEHLPALDHAGGLLNEALQGVGGVRVERKKFAIAVHFREAAPEQVPAVEEAVDEVLRQVAGLRKTGGKKIWELRPDIDWDKGRAVSFLLEKLGLDRPDVFPVYLGDDLTDEDAFRELAGKGLGIIVSEEQVPTEAQYALRDTAEVRKFLSSLGG